MKTKEEFKQIIEQAREAGVTSVILEGVSYAIGPLATQKPSYVEEVKAEEILKPLSSFEEFSDIEVKYWSTGYYDQLQAEKEARLKQQQEYKELKRNSK